MCLFGPDESWEQIIRLISEMKGMNYLSLRWLATGHDDECLCWRVPESTRSGIDDHTMWVYRDREAVKTGLAEMLDVGLEFTQKI